MNRADTQLAGLVRELVRLPHETEWLEFKVDNTDPQAIGEYISALANSAALHERAHGYLVWGVRDDDHVCVGTGFDPSTARKGNEPLENWLVRLLSPRLEFRFAAVELDGARLVVLEVPRAFRHPVKFAGDEFIRITTAKVKLKDNPEKERLLWRVLDRERFEDGVAAGNVAAEDVPRLLDVPAYFELLGLPLPEGTPAMLDALRRDRLIARAEAGGWDIRNLGAVLLARDLQEFRLERKALRVVRYRGRDRTEGEREISDPRGYALSFNPLIERITDLLPSREEIVGASRKTILDFPRIAVREIVANALIHQDFLMRGASPMVEVFDGRVEITNPGEPLVEPDRFLDAPPTSRNEDLAGLMRRFEFCEERGTGFDKAIAAIEASVLPPPRVEVPKGFTRVILFGPRPLAGMDREERQRACYLHAARMYLLGESLTNASVRQRFGISAGNAAIASRLIKDTVAARLIEPFDPGASRREMRYVPWWSRREQR